MKFKIKLNCDIEFETNKFRHTNIVVMKYYGKGKIELTKVSINEWVICHNGIQVGIVRKER